MIVYCCWKIVVCDRSFIIILSSSRRCDQWKLIVAEWFLSTIFQNRLLRVFVCNLPSLFLPFLLIVDVVQSLSWENGCKCCCCCVGTTTLYSVCTNFASALFFFRLYLKPFYLLKGKRFFYLWRFSKNGFYFFLMIRAIRQKLRSVFECLYRLVWCQ